MRAWDCLFGLLALLSTAAPVCAAKCADTSGFDAVQRMVDETMPCAGPRRQYVRGAKKALESAGLSKGCRQAFTKKLRL